MILGFSGYLVFGQDRLMYRRVIFNLIFRFNHWARIRQNYEDHSSLRRIVCRFAGGRGLRPN
jgi:hypothetical protein